MVGQMKLGYFIVLMWSCGSERKQWYKYGPEVLCTNASFILFVTSCIVIKMYPFTLFAYPIGKTIHTNPTKPIIPAITEPTTTTNNAP